MIVQKWYSDEPRVEVELIQLETPVVDKPAKKTRKKKGQVN